MLKRWLGGLLVALVCLSTQADAKVGKGFWKVLVTPNAKWVLHDTVPGTDDADRKAARVTVETYDVRKVDGADVARLRWTHTHGKTKDDLGGSAWMPTQVAVTAAGLYILDASMDDAKISAALKGKPSRSDPPKAYKGTKKNKGRYLHVSGDTVCMGEEPLPGDGECADVCESEVCFSSDGVSSISGLAAPDYSQWER